MNAPADLARELALYLDTAATTPPSAEVLATMVTLQRQAWGNPASLHRIGVEASELLERSRDLLSHALACASEEVVFTSGGTEAIHLALLGAAQALPPGRLLVSAVEHPATLAAAQRLARQGWELGIVPVDCHGLLDLAALERQLEPPTRLVSLIWGQSEVGALEPIDAAGHLCRQRGVLLHVDAVQVVGHRPIAFNALPVDLLSCAAHKFMGPRGVGALLVRRGCSLLPQLGGGGQEGGRRGGTEPVLLAAGMARALEVASDRLHASGDRDPLEPLRDALLRALLDLPGVNLSGPPPGIDRLPHHISLLLQGAGGDPLVGREVVRELARRGLCSSSGSACSSRGSGSSPVLEAMGLPPGLAAAGLRLSLGPWHGPDLLETVPTLVAESMAAVQGR